MSLYRIPEVPRVVVRRHYRPESVDDKLEQQRLVYSSVIKTEDGDYKKKTTARIGAWEVKLEILNDPPTHRPTDRQTDMRGNREVSLPIKGIYFYDYYF